MEAHVVLGQPSWRLTSALVEASVTHRGGMVAPVTFDFGDRKVEPFAVAPWAEAPPEGIPSILATLRGDFFCMPFGLGAADFRGEAHPLHGEPANESWTLVEGDAMRLHARLETRIRPMTIEKWVELRSGQRALYQRHQVRGEGPMTYGMHATLRFPDREGAGVLSTSPFVYGIVFPGEFEVPAHGGYTSLAPGAEFDDLTRAPLERGGTTDLTRYPARDGFEDLAIVYNAPGDFAWSAVTFAEEGYVYWCVKDPRQLSATMLWISNGGRHYSPWNGVHRRVMGVEEVTTALPSGVAEALGETAMRRRGVKTHAVLAPESPMTVSVISGCASVPPGFARVARIEPEAGHLTLIDDTGVRVSVPADLEWLR